MPKQGSKSLASALRQGFYSQVIIVPRLKGFELFYRLIGLIVEKWRVIIIEDPALQHFLAQGKGKLLEDLDVVDVIKEMGIETILRNFCRFLI